MGKSDTRKDNFFFVLITESLVISEYFSKGAGTVPTGPTDLDTVWTATGRRKSYGI
jgi:hypothetical protein